MENYKVYKITNKINGHFYIGYTKLTLEKRFDLHKKSKTNKMPIVSAIKKYGEFNFIIELLFEFDNKKMAIDSEINLIREMKPNYNVHLGGTGGPMYGPMNGMFGKKHSKEWIKTKQQKMLGKNNPMFGKKHSENTKKLISESKIGNIPWNKNKKNVYTEETLKKMKKPKTEEYKNKLKKEYVFKSPEGKVYNVFGLAEFCRNNNLNKGAMCDVWNNKRNSHKGWTK